MITNKFWSYWNQLMIQGDGWYWEIIRKKKKTTDLGDTHDDHLISKFQIEIYSKNSQSGINQHFIQ